MSFGIPAKNLELYDLHEILPKSESLEKAKKQCNKLIDYDIIAKLAMFFDDFATYQEDTKGKLLEKLETRKNKILSDLKGTGEEISKCKNAIRYLMDEFIQNCKNTSELVNIENMGKEEKIRLLTQGTEGKMTIFALNSKEKRFFLRKPDLVKAVLMSEKIGHHPEAERIANLMFILDLTQEDIPLIKQKLEEQKRKNTELENLFKPKQRKRVVIFKKK